MNNFGDWIKLKGRPELGSTFSVTYEYNEGYISQMPDDYQFSLQPGETTTIYNYEKHREFEDVKFDVTVKYIGPAPAYQEPENGNGAPVDGPPFGFLPQPENGNGAVAGPPLLTALANIFPFFKRFLPPPPPENNQG